MTNQEAIKHLNDTADMLRQMATTTTKGKPLAQWTDKEAALVVALENRALACLHAAEVLRIAEAPRLVAKRAAMMAPYGTPST